MPENKALGLSKGPAVPVSREKKYRVILTGDTACEVDDLYAAAYANEQLAVRIAEDTRLGFVGQGMNQVELRGRVPNGEVFELNDLGG